MRKRKRGQPLRRLAAEAIVAFGLLGLLWIAIQSGLVNQFAKALMAPLAPKTKAPAHR